jgi:nitrogen-specific signal transduction histidine kinase
MLQVAYESDVKTEPAVSGDDETAEYIINPATGKAYLRCSSTRVNTGNRVRRNYKNMTAERRKEANARERSRVHVIGAAFERLRTQVPMVLADQKLSKLSVLRIACKYILLLGAMNGRDYSHDQQQYTVDECVCMLNDTIAHEAKYATGGMRAAAADSSTAARDTDDEDGEKDEMVTVD